MIRTAAAILAVAIAGVLLGACGKSSTPPSTNASAASTSSSTPSTSSAPTPSTPDASPTTPGTSPSTPTPTTPNAAPSTPGPPNTGGGSPPQSGRSPRTGRPPAHGLLTKSQAVAFAGAVTILPGDLPEYRTALSEQRPNTGEPRLEHAMLGCVGVLSGHTELAQADSKEFEHADGTGDFGVSSSVAVARTPAIAARGLVLIRDQRARGCLSHYLAQYFGGHAAGASPVHGLTISSEQPLAPGTSGGIVLRIAATVTLGGRLTPIALDFYGFVCGQTQIVLFTTSLPGSFPSRARRELLSLLLARARAHGQCNARSSSPS